MNSNISADLIIIAILVVLLIGCRIVNATSWNDGYCSCGGKWQYQQAVGHRYETMYLYECDRCGKTEEFFHKYVEE